MTRWLPLQVDPLPGRVGGEEDAHRIAVRSGLERCLQVLAPAPVHPAVKQAELAPAEPAGVEDVGQPVQGVDVLGEHDDAVVRVSLADRPKRLDQRHSLAVCGVGDAARPREQLVEQTSGVRFGLAVRADGRQERALRVVAHLIVDQIVIPTDRVSEPVGQRGATGGSRGGVGMRGERAGEGPGRGEEPFLEQQCHEVVGAHTIRRGRPAPGVEVPAQQVMAEALVVGVGHLDLADASARKAGIAGVVDDFVLRPPDHHLSDGCRVGRHPAGEPLRVEHLQQRPPGFAVAVVRRRGQEQPVVGVLAEAPNCVGLLAVNRRRVALPRRRPSTVVHLVNDHQVKETGMPGVRGQHLVE